MENKDSILKLSGFNVDKSIDQMGSADLYYEVLRDFYDESLKRVKRIIDYKNKKDMHNYSIEVHALKSEALYLGIDALGKICLEHQLQSESKNEEFINTHFDELMKELEKTLKAIKQFFNI